MGHKEENKLIHDVARGTEDTDVDFGIIGDEEKEIRKSTKKAAKAEKKATKDEKK